MKLTIAFLLIAVISLSCSRSVDQAALKSEIENANDVFVKAFAGKDADALAQMYTADARLMFPHMPAIEGRENVKQFFQQSLGQGLTSLKLTTESVTGTDEFAIEEGRYEMMAGDTKVDQGNYLVHWKKVDGKWLLHRDMPTTDMALPEPVAQAAP